MADPAPRLRMELSVEPLPVTDQFSRKIEAEQQAQWDSIVGVDISEQGLEKSAEAAQQLGGPPSEIPAEPVQEPSALDVILKTLTGADTAQIQAGIEQGTLSRVIDPAKLVDPFSSAAQEVIQREVERSGMPPEEADKMATMASGLIGLLYPPGATAPRVAAGAEVAVGAGARAAEAAASKLDAPETLARLRAILTEETGALRLGGAAGAVPEPPLPGAGLKGAARVVNTARVEAAEAVKKVMADISGSRPAGQAAPHAKTIREASGFSLDDVLAFDPATVDRKALETALRDHFVAASTKLEELGRRMDAGDATVAKEYAATAAVAARLAVQDKLIGQAFAQGLEARKILSRAERANLAMSDVAGMAQAIEESAGDPRRLRQMFKELKTKGQQQGFLRNLGEAYSFGQDLLHEAWINWILSGPQTHARNVLSNGIMVGLAPPRLALAALLDPGALNGHRAVFFGEAPAAVYGALTGFKRALMLAGRSLRESGALTGAEGVAGANKAERMGLWPSQRWGQESVLGNALDMIYGVFKLGGGPTKALIGEDAFFKVINYDMARHYLAWRTAAQEGREGVAFAARVRELTNNPLPSVKAAAEEFAVIQTLNREFGDMGRVGKLGQWLTGVRNVVPLGRVNAPFMRTPFNELHVVSEHLPLLNMLSDTIQADVAAGGAKRAEALAKITMGLMVGGSMAMYATAPIDSENPVPYMTRITGAGPKDPGLRASLERQGWRPWAVYAPGVGKYISIQGLGPPATVVNAVAQLTELLGHVGEGFGPVIFSAAKAIGQTMLDKSYFTGVSDFMTAMEGSPQDVDKYIRTLERSIAAPAFVRQFESAISPERASTKTGGFAEGSGDPIWHELEKYMKEAQSVIPYLSDSLPVELNVWGDAQVVPPGFGSDVISRYLSPIKVTTPKPDLVEAELVRERISIKLPSQYVRGSAPPSPFSTEPPPMREPGYKLDEWQYARYVLLAGKGGKAPDLDAGDPMYGRPALKERLESVMKRPDWKTFSQWEKNLRVQTEVNAYRKLALEQLKKEDPELRKGLVQHEQEIANTKRRLTDPKSPGFLPGMLTR